MNSTSREASFWSSVGVLIAFRCALMAAGGTLLALPCTALSQARWEQKAFVLGTFYGPPFNFAERSLEADSARFREARNEGFNLLTGTQGEGGIDHSFEGMKWALTVASRAGLQYLVSDSRFFEAHRHPFDGATAQKVAEDYTHLPASLRTSMYGYMLCDEPQLPPDQKTNVALWKSALEAADPAKLCYINLVASYAADNNWGGFTGGNSDGVLDDRERISYENYLAYYIDTLRPAVVSFDHYPFFKDGGIRRDYFYNLQVICRKAGGRPVWTFPMTVGHLTYVDPEEPHLYFMYFSPLAYGVKGLLAFTYWTPPESGYRSALFDQQGRRMPRADIVRRLNYYVAKVLGPVIMGAKHIAVYHVSDFPDGQVFLADTLTAASPWLTGKPDRRLLFGVFQDELFVYVLVVNKALVPLHDVDIALRGIVRTVAMSPRVVGFDESSPVRYRATRTTVNAAQSFSSFKIPELAGGEGRLVRFIHR